VTAVAADITTEGLRHVRERHGVPVPVLRFHASTVVCAPYQVGSSPPGRLCQYAPSWSRDRRARAPGSAFPRRAPQWLSPRCYLHRSRKCSVSCLGFIITGPLLPRPRVSAPRCCSTLIHEQCRQRTWYRG
jgi:hypothetical protein